MVIGAHLDAWDLGTGAIDDGAGVAMALDTMRIAASMPRAPRRTLRVVLFMNEENGTEGAVAYHEEGKAAGTRHVAALEADSGGGPPPASRSPPGRAGSTWCAGWRPRSPASGWGASPATAAASDISPLAWAGVPQLNVAQETTRYFDWHHSAADTLDKVDPADLARATAAFAWIAWSLADGPEVLPPPPAPDRAPWWKAVTR